MTPLEKEKELKKLAEKLRRIVVAVSLKGIGESQFLYAIGKGRAVEISFDENDCVWVEYWDDCLDEDASSVGEKTFTSIEKAEESVKSWLLHSS